MGWTAHQQAIYLEHQFKAQHSSYRSKFPRASYRLVLVDGERAGRIYLDRRKDEIRILDLSLLPKFQNQGVGTRLIGDLCDEARGERKDVGVHVPKGSRANRLAERLGFALKFETDRSNFMLWSAATVIA